MDKVYLIAYDLDSPGQRYKEFQKALTDSITGPWCHYLESTYIFRSKLTPSKIMDNLKPHIDSNDRVFITEIVDNHQGWLDKDQWDFINNKIF